MLPEDFRRAPFLRILFPLIGGIIMGRNTGYPPGTEWICMACSFIFLIISLWNRRQTLIPLLMIFLFAGIGLGREPSIKDLEEAWISARICSEVQRRGKGNLACIDKICRLDGDRWTRVKGRASVYFADSSDSSVLMPGMTLLVKAALIGFSSPQNPEQFDFGRYQRGRGIFYRVYLDRGSWISFQALRLSLRDRSLLFRRKLISWLDEEIEDMREKAVLEALLLGYRDNLETVQEQNFARSGSMHILAVSGLHVGILYFLPALLLKRLKSFPLIWFVCNILLFIVLWMYAGITGLSSSVVRAVCMCCIYGVAKMSRRKISSAHVLSLAAFLMIIVRPPVVFEAGFQLSFAAVCGILMTYSSFLKLFPFGGWAGRRISQMMAVSLAAQLSTLPLSIAYFNQFSPAAMLANLLVIPLATLILYGGLIFFLFMGAGIPASLPASVLSLLSQGLEVITRLTAGLPGAFLDGLSLSAGQVILFYITGITGLLFIQHRHPRMGFCTLISLVVLLAGSGIREMEMRQHQGMYVFSLANETAIGFVNGREAGLFQPGLSGTGDMPYEISGFFRKRRLEPEIISAESELPFLWQGAIHSPGIEADYIMYLDKRILILRHWDRQFTEEIPTIHTDILVLCNNPGINSLQIIKFFQPSCVVADGSNYTWFTRKIGSDCRNAGLSFHSTREQGYFKIE